MNIIKVIIGYFKADFPIGRFMIKIGWNNSHFHNKNTRQVVYLISILQQGRREERTNLLADDGWEEQNTWSLWSPPTILMLRMRSSSSSCSSLSVLVVAGRPDLMLTSLKHPTAKSPCMMHLLTNGLYRCGWSNRLTKDHTCHGNHSSITNFDLEVQIKDLKKIITIIHLQSDRYFAIKKNNLCAKTREELQIF